MTDTTTRDERPDEDYVELPPEPGRLRKVLFVLGGLLVFIGLMAALGGWWLYKQVDPGNPGQELTITVPPGSTTSQIGTLLEAKGVITNATVFQYYAKFRGAGPFKAGNYDGLRQHSSMGAVIDRLEAGPLPPKYTEMAVPEGLWLQDIRALILKTFPQMDPGRLDTALRSVRSKYQPQGSDNLEGLLFPAVYRVQEGDEGDEQKLVQQMVTKFDQVGDEIGLDKATERLKGQTGKTDLTPYQVVTVASMIEAEAKLPEDKAKIARVIYNRLAQDMQLGIDATVIYALGEHLQSLTSSQLKVDSPYNTRQKKGLPPTPIGSPGKASLEAALNPAEGDWLYYVLADENGGHYFTADYNDFLRAQREAQKKGLL